MTEFAKLPGNIRQFVNFQRSRGEITNTQAESTFIRLALQGYLTLIPEEVHQSRILEKPDLLQAAGDMIQFQLAFNDRIDYQYSGRTDIDDLIYDSAKKEQAARNQLDLSLHALENPAEAFRLQGVVNNLARETEFVEQFIRTKPQIKYEDALQYRRLVNAIAMCSVTRMLMREKYQGSKLSETDKTELTWEGVNNKYAWLFNSDNNGLNRLEIAMKIMERLTTVAQLDDDLFGRHIDEKLNVPSTALTAIHDQNGNVEKAEDVLNNYRRNFLSEARTLGVGVLPSKAFSTTFKEMQRATRIFTRNARKYHNLLQHTHLHAPKMFARHREMAYIRGQI